MNCITTYLKMYTIFALCIILLGAEDRVVASQQHLHTPATAKYVPNQILVKFRAQPKQSSRDPINENPVDATIADSLKRINHHLQVRKIHQVFREFTEQKKQMEILGNKNPSQLTNQEKRLLQRSRRAPTGIHVPALDRIYLVELEEWQDSRAALEAYQQDPAVEYAEYNYILYENVIPTDSHFPIQWPLNNTGQLYPESGSYNDPPGTDDADIDAPEAWDIFTGSSDVIVAVIDTGVDYTHRDIDDNMWVNPAELNGMAGLDDDLNGHIDDIYGYDFHNHDGDPMDDRGHGTHCAGTIAAEGNNAQDLSGVCWQSRIMAVKFLDSLGQGLTSNAVLSFYYAVKNGADVCSNSWGGGAYSQTLEEVIDYARSQGVVMLASAGNDNSETPKYPAYYPSMIAVGATDSNDDKATFSNYGSWVDIAAPGVDILSLRSSQAGSFGTPHDDYTFILSGTSMACPHVAGACALLLGANPTLKVEQVYTILMTTGDPIAPGICSSNSRLNVYQMLLQSVPSAGRVQFTRGEYSCSDTVDVVLADGDLAGFGTQAVSITSTGGDLETLNLTERSTGIGVFDGAVTTASGPAIAEDSILEILDGQTLTVTYHDANDGTGHPAIVEDTSAIDCAGPVISDVQPPQTGAFWARISVETDEPSRTVIQYGNNPHNLKNSAEDLPLATTHYIYLYHLSSESTYYFAVTATDEFDNSTTDDNAGQCYSFTTRSEVAGLHVPIEYPTIQTAIDAAPPGETVWIADGLYTGDGNRDLDFGGKAITVRSEYGPDFCVIDSQGSVGEPHCGFYFHSGENALSVVEGITISGGHAEYIEYIGGGIVCENSSPTIINCIISDNVAAYGGGMKNTNSNPTITDCRFIGNAAHVFGGAMDNYGSHPIVTNSDFINNLTDSPYSDEWGGGAVGNDNGSHPVFTSCRFENNFTYGLGAGMYNEGSCDPVLIECLFIDNYAEWGGAGLASDYTGCDPYLVNCRFINNTAGRQGGGIYCGSNNTLTVINGLFDNNKSEGNTGGGIWIYNSTMQVVNSTFYQNEALSFGGGIYIQSSVTGEISNCIFLRNRDFEGYALDAQIYGWADIGLYYNCIENWTSTTGPAIQGNTGEDPRFLDPDGDDEIIGTEDDNLRPGPGSPCLEAGDNNRVPADTADLDKDGDYAELIPWDLDGKARFVDDPNTPDSGLPGADPQAAVVDIGAYEGPYQGFLIEPQQISVPEGSTSALTVALSLSPQETVMVEIVYHNGDPDISVQSGAVLTFDSSNYDQPQTVVLAAADDEDFINGITWFAVVADAIPVKKVAVNETDNEPVPPVVYVDAAAAGTQNGLNWANAFTDLQTPLKHALDRPGIAEIRVAQGTYRPGEPGGDHNTSFMLFDGLALRGGYAGIQHPDPNARDILRYETILSGDLNDDDKEEFEHYQDNSYHVVTGRQLSADTVLDGFTIEAGNANGMDVHANGGGMLNYDGSHPVVTDCHFRLNTSDGNGSGMYNENSNPHVIRCRFTGNAMGGNSGAGMFNIDSSPLVEDCEFIDNNAGVGGGIANNGSGSAVLVNCLFLGNEASFGAGLDTRDECTPVFIDCRFESNHAGYTGGGVEIRGGNATFTRCQIINNEAGTYDWGGAGINMYGGQALFESCVIAGNHSGENGGAMFVWNGHATLANCTLADNTANDQGGGIFFFSHLSGSVIMQSCISWNPNEAEVQGKSMTAQYCDVEGGYTGIGNIFQDPRFVNPSGRDYHLRWDSPCIDRGDPVYILQISQTDIDGEPRFMGAGRVDMGSDEVGPRQSDFTRNGIVDIADLSVLLNSWLFTDQNENWYVLCDLVPNQQIDMADFARFSEDWFWMADWYDD